MVSRALPVHPGEDDEERRRVDRAVVTPEGHFAQAGELTLAHLVQDLPRLHVGRPVLALGLVRGEEAQHPARERGLDPQHLDRGEDAVAAEGGREPGHAGVGIGAVRRVGHEHRQVGDRALEHAVEYGIRSLDERRVGARGGERAARDASHDEEAPLGWGRALALEALHGQRDRPALARGEVELEFRALGR